MSPLMNLAIVHGLASFPLKIAPSMLPKYFCDVKSPARVKFRIGVD